MSEQPEDHRGAPAEVDGAVVLNKRYPVVPDARLADLDAPTARAFAARDLRSPERSLFALICDRRLPPRTDVIKSLSPIEIASIVRPLDHGILAWPPAGGQEHYVVLFEKPGGGRVFAAGAGPEKPMREDELIRGIMRPLVQSLMDLHGRNLPHRAVRADNLFFADPNREAVILGECVSGQPGFSQPAIYEPIDLAMANPAGRGQGNLSDDIYAFGVLLVTLLHGGDPCAGQSEQEVVAAKLTRGSYAALVSKARASLNLMEPLRGMLCDDPRERWSAQDLFMWLNGRQQTPKQQVIPQKVAWPLEFGGETHNNLRVLADAMARDWPGATETIRSPRFADWLSHVANNEKAGTPMLRRVLDSLSGRAQSARATDELTARAVIALDPPAPLRYKGFAAVPEAVGQALAIDFHRPNATDQFREITKARLAFTWMEAQASSTPIFVQIKKQAELIESFLGREGWGFGVERCLYELTDSWPCQSPILERFLVCEIDQLLPALDKLASEGPPDFSPVDPHIAAFCAVLLKNQAEQPLGELDSTDPATHRIGVLRLLSLVQRAANRQPAPATARWLARLMSPVIETFHNRPYRAKLAAKLEEVSKEGDLSRLLSLVDNQKARDQDREGFQRAKAMFEHAGKEIRWLEQGGLTSKDQVMKGSRYAAALTTSVVSGLTLLVLTFAFVF